MPHHVILGAGPAGLNAIETIRQLDPGAGITLISDERAYARMALPYFIARQIPEEQLLTGSDESFARLRVDRHIGRRAVKIDTGSRFVELDNGERVSYGSLLIATGSSPLRPPIPGADGRHVHSLWTFTDTTAMLASARAKRPSAVIVGGGFIGLIIVNALHRLGWKIAVVEIEGHILPGMLDRRGASAAEAWLRARGIDIYGGCGVREITGARKKTVHLSDGQVLDANVVILSTGIRPNTGFLAGSGIRVDQGVVVDERMQSNMRGVYAAGDVAQGPALLGGPPTINAIQTTAVDHGRVAGANMAGRGHTYPGSLVMNILDVTGLQCASFGRWRDGGDSTVIWAPSRPVYRKLVWDGTRLIGAIMLGPLGDTTMLTDVGMVKGLIQSRAQLGKWKRYLQDRPWDLRRVYIASQAAAQLLPQTCLGTPAAPRAYRFNNLGPRTEPGPHHAEIIGTRPPGFDSLPRTPAPGIHKTTTEPDGPT